jgi:hypothetical protein
MRLDGLFLKQQILTGTDAAMDALTVGAVLILAYMLGDFLHAGLGTGSECAIDALGGEEQNFRSGADAGIKLALQRDGVARDITVELGLAGADVMESFGPVAAVVAA